MKAQEDDPTFGCMSSVMKEGTIAIPPPMPNGSALTPARTAMVGNFLSVSALHIIRIALELDVQLRSGHRS